MNVGRILPFRYSLATIKIENLDQGMVGGPGYGFLANTNFNAENLPCLVNVSL